MIYVFMDFVYQRNGIGFLWLHVHKMSITAFMHMLRNIMTNKRFLYACVMHILCYRKWNKILLCACYVTGSKIKEIHFKEDKQ